MFYQKSAKQALLDTLRLIIYFLLFSLGIFFILKGDVWERYVQKRTNFAIHTKDITELPTIATFIQPFGLKLGVDFNLSVQAHRSGAIDSSTEPTQLMKSGVYPVFAEENYEPFQIDFENNLYNGSASKITPIVDSKAKLYRIGDLAMSYTFKDANTSNLEKILITVTLTSENNSIAGSYLIGKTKSYDGKRLTHQSQLGQLTKLVWAATKYVNLDIYEVPCRHKPFNEILFHKISEEIKSCTHPCRVEQNFGHKLNNILSHLPSCKTEMEKACFASVAKDVHNDIASKPCTRLEYSWVEIQDISIEEKHKVTFLLQMGSPKTVSVNEEYLIYDFVAMISAVGGTMGLCIGFSFFDFCGFILGYLEKGMEKFKRGKVVKRNTTTNVRTPVETANSKLETLFESVTKIERKILSMDNNIKTLQNRMLQFETK